MKDMMDVDRLQMFLRHSDTKTKHFFIYLNQCAPLICHLKPAQLISISSTQKSDFQTFLKTYQLKHIILYQQKEFLISLIYNFKALTQLLQQEEIKDYLLKNGYSSCGFHKSISILKLRMLQYYRNKIDYPNEVGVFLGYTLDDVCAFQKYGGKAALYHGYWSVYSKVKEKKEIFNQYDLARYRVLDSFLTEVGRKY